MTSEEPPTPKTTGFLRYLTRYTSNFFKLMRRIFVCKISNFLIFFGSTRSVQLNFKTRTWLKIQLNSPEFFGMTSEEPPTKNSWKTIHFTGIQKWPPSKLPFLSSFVLAFVSVVKLYGSSPAFQLATPSSSPSFRCSHFQTTKYATKTPNFLHLHSLLERFPWCNFGRAEVKI